MRRMLFSAAAALTLQTSAGLAQAHVVWYNTTNAQTSGSYSGVARGPQGVTMSIAFSGYSAYTFDLSLDVPSNVSVTGVQFCYYMSAPQVFIYSVDMYESTNPLTTLLHSDVQLNSDQRVCTSFPVPARSPTAPFAVRVAVVANAVHTMTLAAVGLEMQPVSVSVVAPGPSQDLELRQSFPNPASAHAVIDFETSEGEWARLQIHDAAGRLIRTLDAGIQASGRGRVIWDARDNSGHEVAPGVYFYRLVTPRATSDVRRLAIVR